MIDNLDMVFLARAQFAFTVALHIIFPSFTIGLASYLAVLEGLWLKTGRAVYLSLYRFWVKIFAISFGMGVVSGVVMSYQFGTNWSVFSELTGNVLGPLLGYEVLTAFFLEASFLAIMLFGWDKVGRRLHFFSTCTVAVGTLMSAFWILSANSWMHTPAGYEIREGVFYAVNWWEVVFNPSFPYRFVHMVLAAYLTTGFVVIAVAAFHILRDRHNKRDCNEASVVMMKMGLVFVAIVTPLQIIAGHSHGVNVLEMQPVKLAAMEANWEAKRGVPLVLFALPNQEAERNDYELAIPKLASLVVAHDLNAELPRLKDWPPDERPPVAVVFWSFRIMVGMGLLMLLVAAWGVLRLKQGRLTESRRFLQLCMLTGPSGFIAVLAGWFTAEVGRQPYTVYGLLRTADSVSPITANSVGMSLIVFIFTYLIVLCSGVYYLSRLAAKAPQAVTPDSEDLRSQPVLGSRIEIADYEHDLSLQRQGQRP